MTAARRAPMGAEAARHAGDARKCEGEGDTRCSGAGEGGGTGSNDQGACQDGGGGAAGDVGPPPDTPPALLTSPPASSAPVEQQSPTQEEVKRGTGVREVEKEVWDDQLRRAQERARSIVGLKSRR